MQSALFQIAPRLGVAIELLLIKNAGLLKHGSRIGWRSTVLLEVSEALVKGQMAEPSKTLFSSSGARPLPQIALHESVPAQENGNPTLDRLLKDLPELPQKN
jgi:predicted lysophospholipase L1 biosynthesis ABC-type transport system permease subunit